MEHPRDWLAAGGLERIGGEALAMQRVGELGEDVGRKDAGVSVLRFPHFEPHNAGLEVHAALRKHV